TFKASRIITQEDVNSGRLENIATLTGHTVGNVPVSATSHGPGGQPTQILFVQKAGSGAQLTGAWLDENGNGVADVGERIEYRISISNTGNVALTDIDLQGILPQGGLPPGSRPLALPISQTIADLQPGGTRNLSYYYILTQADIDQGVLAAQLKAAGLGPSTLQTPVTEGLSDDPGGGAEIDTDGDGQPDRPAIVALPQLVRLSVEKGGSFLDADVAREGTRIEYTIRITNTGNVTVSDVAPDDSGPSFSGVKGTGALSPFMPEKVVLAPGEAAEFKAIYTMSASDVDRTLSTVESIHNVAGAVGKAMNGAAPEVIPGEVKLTPPGIALSKLAHAAE